MNSKRNLYRCILALWAYSSIQVWAQEIRIDTVVYSSIAVEMLSIDDGLSQGMINDVVEDQNGYLWIATKEGLNRYDGTSVKVYRHDPLDPTSLDENYIGRLHLDGDNRLWIATQSKGLDLYVRETDNFKHFNHNPKTPHSISTNHPHRVMNSPSGELLVWSRDKNQLEIAPINVADGDMRATLSFQSVCDYYPGFGSDGRCWLDQYFVPTNNSKDASGFTTDGLLWIYDGKDSVYCFPPEALLGDIEPFKYPVENDVVSRHMNVLRCLFFDQAKSNAFITDGRRSIWRIDPVSHKRELYIYLPEGLTVEGPVLIGASKDIWIHTAKDTICRIVPDEARLEVFSMKGEWIASNLASPMIEDRFGNIWLPTGGYGLAKINARQKRFHHLVKPDSYGSVYPSWPYRLESPGKSKAFGGKDWARFMSVCDKSLKAKLNLQGTLLHRSLSVDASQNIWCVYGNLIDADGIGRTCLVEIDVDGPVEKTRIEHSVPPDNTEHHFVPLFFDRQGNLWFGKGDDQGTAELYLYRPHSDNLVSFRFPLKADPLHYRFISDWWEDESGCWWLATVKGLFRLNPETSQWKHFSAGDAITSPISMDILLSLCPDPVNPKEFIWVGTEGGGLNKLNRETGECLVYGVADGLPNNVIYGIQSDHYGNLWLSTNRGLCWFNPITGNTRIFTEDDGLNGNEFNRYEYSKGEDGTMYFGGVKGTTAFHPKDFYRDSIVADIVINGLRILNKPVRYTQGLKSESQFELAAPLEQTSSLTFSHDIGMITLTYSLLDFTVPDQYTYKYMLEGQDDVWIEAGNSREATYTSLRPGDYTFRVMGLNSHNQWSKETTMTITILPPWWGTWWFRTLIVVAIVGMLYALYRYRLAQVVQVERMRNRIAQDLHDEIGSTLSSISLYSAVIQKSATGIPEESQLVLEKISSSTTEMMESMNDIVWTIKADNDSFLNVINRMRAFAVNMTESRGIHLEFQVKGEMERLKLSMDQRKNIYLVFKEAVNNSVKYAESNEIVVFIALEKGRLQLLVKDDGKGFDPIQVMTNRELLGGNGLRGMKSRANEIGAELLLTSVPDNGTEIGLLLKL